MLDRSLGVLVILILALCLSTGAVTVGGVSAHGDGSTDGQTETGVSVSASDKWATVPDAGLPNGADIGLFVAQQDAEDEPPDNETRRHEHPNQAQAEGDESRYADWLSNQLSGALSQSTVELSEGQYDRARSVIGDEYDDRLEQFVEVSDEVETGTGEADEDTDEATDPAEEFQESRENQREFITSVEQYQTTYAEYQEARDAGDEDRALSLARELEEFEEQVNESSNQVVQHYENVSSTSDRDLAEEIELVVEIDEEIAEQQQEVRESEFERTEIDADVVVPEASFLEPLVIGGTVTTEDGEPVDEGQIAVQVDGRVTTTTITDGTYEMEYRPALLPENATAVPVLYVPDNETVYLQSETEVPIDSQRTQPTIEITNATETASYGDVVTIEGRLIVDDTPVDQVPVGASFENGGITDINRTDGSGSFTIEATVPEDVPAGDSPLQISYPLEDRTLESTVADQPIRIEETDTDLSLDANINDSGGVDVSGALQTADGEPLANQSVRLSIGDQVLGTIDTNDDGAFETRVEVPDGIESGTVELVATYEDEETNLADDRTVQQLSVADGWGFQIGPPLYWAIASVLLIVLGVTVLTTRSSGRTPLSLLNKFRSGTTGKSSDVLTDENHGKTDDEDDPHDESTEEDPTGSRPTIPMPGTVAQRILQAGDTDAATAAAYAITRRRLAADIDTDPSNTHWEFYDIWRTTQGETGASSLKQLTELYERAAYAPVTVSEREATEVIELANELVSQQRQPTGDR